MNLTTSWIVRWIAGSTMALALTVPGLSEDWPQFRGHNASGVSRGSKNLPVTFSAEENVKWKVELGEGIACPVIARGRVFTTAMTAEKMFAVFAFDAASGKRLWKREFDAGTLPEITRPNTHASSTPATDGERVFVYFSTFGLRALDARDGSVIWEHELPLPSYLLGWGCANSPIVHENLVIFNRDDDLAPFLLALDKRSGEVRWRTERPDMLGGYAVPVVCAAANRTDIVVAGSGKLKGYDPKTGRERWTCNSLLRTVMTTPVVEGDRIFISIQSYGESTRMLKSALLQWKDTNQDGKLAKSEVGAAFQAKFERGDKNKDGELEGAEIDAAFQSPNNMVGGGNIVQAIRGGGAGDVTKTNIVWNLDNKAPSNISSPLLYDGRLFVVKKGGISASFDAKTGRTNWIKKRIRNLGNYYASPIAGDGKIYVPGENGSIVVLESAPELNILGKCDMQDSLVATPAIADNRIYVRTLNGLFCIAEESE